jgi:hypothetical protein
VTSEIPLLSNRGKIFALINHTYCLAQDYYVDCENPILSELSKFHDSQYYNGDVVIIGGASAGLSLL